MPRAKNAAPKIGDNTKGKLTEDEASALTTYCELKIIEGQRKLDALMVRTIRKPKANGRAAAETAAA
jgi:hypothetical protein